MVHSVKYEVKSGAIMIIAPGKMKMSNNPTKYEVLIKQYVRSILDITASPVAH